MWVCEAQAWMCGNAGKSWSAARCAPRAFLFRLANEEKADEHRRYGQCYESEPFHRLPRPLMNPHVDVAMTGVHHVFPALDAVERRCRGCRTARGLGTHVLAKKGPFGRFGMGILVWTSGGVSHRRAWKAPADALCVAPALRGLSSPSGKGRSEHCGVPQVVEVPNPSEFLG